MPGCSILQRGCRAISSREVYGVGGGHADGPVGLDFEFHRPAPVQLVGSDWVSWLVQLWVQLVKSVVLSAMARNAAMSALLVKDQLQAAPFAVVGGRSK